MGLHDGGEQVESSDRNRKTTSMWGERDLSPGLPVTADPANDREVLESFDASPTREKTSDLLTSLKKTGENRTEYLKSLVDVTLADHRLTSDHVNFHKKPALKTPTLKTKTGLTLTESENASSAEEGMLSIPGLHVSSRRTKIEQTSSGGTKVPPNTVLHPASQTGQIMFDAKIHNQVNNGLVRNRNFVSHSTTVNTLDAKLWYMRQNELLQKLSLKLSDVTCVYNDILSNLLRDIDLYADSNRRFFDLRKTAYATAHGTCPIRLPDMEQALTEAKHRSRQGYKRQEEQEDLNTDLVFVHGQQGSVFNSVYLSQTKERNTKVGRQMEDGEHEDRMAQIYAQNKKVFSYNSAHFLNKNGQSYRRSNSAEERSKLAEEDTLETLTRGRRSSADWDATKTLPLYTVEGRPISALGKSAQALMEVPLEQNMSRDISSQISDEIHGTKKTSSAPSPHETRSQTFHQNDLSPGGSIGSRGASKEFLDPDLVGSSHHHNAMVQSRSSSTQNITTGEGRMGSSPDRPPTEEVTVSQTLAGARVTIKTGSPLSRKGTGISMATDSSTQGVPAHKHPRRRTLLGPVTIWADNVNPYPCGSRKMAEKVPFDPLVKPLEYRKSRPSEYDHPMFDDVETEVQKVVEHDDEDESDDFFEFVTKKKVDPLEKIKAWKPRLPLESEIDMSKPKFIDGTLINNTLIESHEKTIPDRENWLYDMGKVKRGFFMDIEKNPIVSDVKNMLYHEKTNESVIMLNFLEDMIDRQKTHSLPFRSFDNLHVPKKNEEIFKSAQEKTEAKKIKRMIVKACALLSLRGLRDILHITEEEWNQARLPLRLISVKMEVMSYLADEARDLERASFWRSMAETQKMVDHKRVTAYPAKHESLPRMDIGQAPYKQWYARSMSPDRRRMEGSARQVLKARKAAAKAERRGNSVDNHEGAHMMAQMNSTGSSLNHLFSEFDRKRQIRGL
ncbi:unnamed protein product [Amoebophrya sp. A120]|nr:unnamed protein product [Amoebophrya sp. A120]|eukprot:GSA120T00021753001.1